MSAIDEMRITPYLEIASNISARNASGGVGVSWAGKIELTAVRDILNVEVWRCGRWSARK